MNANGRRANEGRVRRLLLLLLVVTALCSGGTAVLAQESVPAPQTQPKGQTVYITRTGKKYHRENCRYLSQSKFSMSLKDAKAKGYTACSVCRPAR
jgi:hypothetical protein